MLLPQYINTAKNKILRHGAENFVVGSVLPRNIKCEVTIKTPCILFRFACIIEISELYKGGGSFGIYQRTGSGA